MNTARAPPLMVHTRFAEKGKGDGGYGAIIRAEQGVLMSRLATILIAMHGIMSKLDSYTQQRNRAAYL
jgi:hypothetical protein